MKDYEQLLRWKSKLHVRMLRIANTVRDEKTRDNLLSVERSFLRMIEKDIKEAKEKIVIVNKITRQSKIKFLPLGMN